MYYVCYNVYDPVTRDSAESCDSIPTKDYVGPKPTTINEPELLANSTLDVLPNPFDQYLQIKFTLIAEQQVQLQLNDISGRTTYPILSTLKTAGQHTLIYNGSKMPEGVYILRMITSTGDIKTRIVVKK
jgi:hypothetical protein